MFVARNDREAKKQVIEVHEQFGWKDILDLGDITAARGMEMILPLWVRIMGTINSVNFGFRVVRLVNE